MRRTILGAPVALLACFWPARAADPAVARRASAIAQVERQLPWFWSPSAEGLADIPYTYEELLSRRFLKRSGAEIPANSQAGGLTNWRSVRLERIPLEFGAFLRCLSQDGATPCSKEWDQELERQSKRREELTPEERARVERAREERRQRRRAFWDRFPAAMNFEGAGADQLRFSAADKGGRSLLGALKGELRFDAATSEVTRMEYELLRDVDDVFLKRPKGTRFSIDLTKAADDHYFPARIRSWQQRGKSDEFEERTVDFSNFRRFGSESSIRFADDLPDR